MKIKQSFVTNSSSTSFIIIGKQISGDEVKEKNWIENNIKAVFDAGDGYVLLSYGNYEELVKSLKEDWELENDVLNGKDLMFFESSFAEIQYRDVKKSEEETNIDIPKGTKVFTFRCPS